MWIMKFLWMKGTQRCLSTEKTTENGLSLYSGVAGPHRVATSVVGELQEDDQLLSYIQTQMGDLICGWWRSNADGRCL